MLELYLDNVKVDMDSTFKINMTYQSTDLQNPEAKINNYSKTVKIQGTHNNNSIFGHIFRFDTNILTAEQLVGVSFDPNKRIPFIILDDGSLYESGYAQLDNISIVNDIITYSLTLYGIIGSFFYNLKYNEDGTEKTLYDMYYGLIDLNGNTLSKEDENRNILFEYNKNYVNDCWLMAMHKTEGPGEYDKYADTDIRKFMCPIACYQGYYDNFESDTVLVNTVGLDLNSPVVKHIDSDDKTYWPDSNWVKVKLDRETSNFEMNDIRSHYLPYGIRLQAIYDAMKNPENNGGFEVDDSNISEIEKKYIYEGFIMQNPFEWDDINANNINTTIYPGYSADRASLSNRIVYFEKVDLSKFINPNATLYVMPRINTNYATDNLNTQSIIYGGIYHTVPYGRINVIQQANFYGSDSIQYFWAEALDENGNIVQRSDVYMYGDKPYDDNNNPLFLYNVTGAVSETLVFSGYNSGDTGASPSAIKYFLDRNGLKLKESSLTYYEKTYDFPGYYINDDNLGVAINRSHLSDGYNANTNKVEFTGKEFKINLKLNKNVKSIRIITDSIVTQWTADPYDEIGTKNWPYSPTPNLSTKQYTFNPGFCDFVSVSENLIHQEQNGNIKYYSRGTNQMWFDWDKISGMISDKSQIYDGAVETIEERHTVDKYSLLQNTEAPYDYLIGLAKMFNWKLEHDIITNKINIYSLNNYYKNIVTDINDKVDFSNIKITPTTSKTNNYKFELELDESYCSTNWKKANKNDYGSTSISTKYEFSDEPENVLEDCVFKTAIPYIQRSVFFNNDNNYWVRPALGKYADVSMWYRFDNKSEKSEKRFGKLRELPLETSQMILDVAPRLCLFDKDYSSIDMNNTLVFFNSKNTVDAQKTINLSDNIEATNQLIDNNCYIYIYDTNANVITDIENYVVDKPIMPVNFIPNFNTHFEYNNTEYWGTLKAEPLEPNIGIEYKNYNDIYNLCWKNYITDLYNKNNKVVTVKMHLNDSPRNAMKQFYTFKNAIWVINKITDYNIDEYLTKIEFIQVQNINNYLGI